MKLESDTHSLIYNENEWERVHDIVLWFKVVIDKNVEVKLNYKENSEFMWCDLNKVNILNLADKNIKDIIDSK